jgi:hypothetical protein
MNGGAAGRVGCAGAGADGGIVGDASGVGRCTAGAGLAAAAIAGWGMATGSAGLAGAAGVGAATAGAIGGDAGRGGGGGVVTEG